MCVFVCGGGDSGGGDGGGGGCVCVCVVYWEKMVGIVGAFPVC